MSTSRTSYRGLTDWERAILLQLFKEPFPGRDTLRTQLDNAACRSIDENGSLEFECATTEKAAVKRRIPTEAEVHDSDGVLIHYLLHVVEGVMNELEVFKEDGAKVLRQPEPKELRVIVLD